MLHELQAVIRPKTQLKGVINVAVTTFDKGLSDNSMGIMTVHLIGLKEVVGHMCFPHQLIDSARYALVDSAGYALLSSETERSET
jgi:hypothetical protein